MYCDETRFTIVLCHVIVCNDGTHFWVKCGADNEFLHSCIECGAVTDLSMHLFGPVLVYTVCRNV